MTATAPRRITTLVLALAMALGMLVVPATVPAADAATVAPDLESQLMALTNRERAARGLPALQTSLQMTRVARDWSQTMADEQRLYHRPDLKSVASGNWTRIGENVGVGPSIERIHQAFMDSPGHKANVLGDWKYVGIGVIEHDGRLWLTLNFLQGTGDFPAFQDVTTTVHRANIETVFARATTNGCTSDRFCPGTSVTRAQMASFLARELGLTPTAPSGLSDVPSNSVHAGNIGALTEAGIATPCASGRFCPSDPITRADMASWVAAALDLAPVDPSFGDVLSSDAAAGAIGALEQRGIVNGCGDGRYCPREAVNRGQMTAFLARAWN
ncbi:MAG: S-layer homology domain-containing protein [Nitriliruptor sp.]